MPLLILSLLLVAVAWPLLEGYYAPATHDRYTVVRRMDEGDAVVAVVRRNELLYLLYDETVIGAEFDHPTVRDQTVFPGFAIMQCAAYLQDKPTRAVQIGLGIGSVPTFLRAMAIPTGSTALADCCYSFWYTESDDKCARYPASYRRRGD